MQAEATAAPSAVDVCEEVVEQWKKNHGFSASFEEETRRVIARCNSWINDKSVAAGVMDVFSASRSETQLSLTAIQELGVELGTRLMREGLLIASRR